MWSDDIPPYVQRFLGNVLGVLIHYNGEIAGYSKYSVSFVVCDDGSWYPFNRSFSFHYLSEFHSLLVSAEDYIERELYKERMKESDKNATGNI